MVLEVKIHPDPILRQVCTEVTTFDEHLLKTIEDMYETMHAYQGVGLAGPQIGLLKQILVLQFETTKMALINPKIIETGSHQIIGEEGCLSLPKVLLQVSRADKVIVEAQNKKGKKIKIKEKGFISRIIQHEMDHLNGVLILDRAVPLPD